MYVHTYIYLSYFYLIYIQPFYVGLAQGIVQRFDKKNAALTK